MKKFLSLFVGIFIFYAATGTAGGGTSIGNGGSSVVCRARGGSIQNASLFDLFEGFSIFNLGYTERPEPAAQQALALVPTLEKILNISLERNLTSLIERMHLLPPGVGLAPTEDLANFIIPKGCEIAQTINYRDDGDIYADSEIWNKLSNTHRAAAYIHELIYEFTRAHGHESSSVRVRRAVSLLFSGSSLEPVLPPFNFSEKCQAGNSVFYTHPLKNGSVEFFFTSINHRAALSQTIVRSEKPTQWPLTSSLQEVSWSSKATSLIERGITVTFESNQKSKILTIKEPQQTTKEVVSCELSN